MPESSLYASTSIAELLDGEKMEMAKKKGGQPNKEVQMLPKCLFEMPIVKSLCRRHQIPSTESAKYSQALQRESFWGEGGGDLNASYLTHILILRAKGTSKDAFFMFDLLGIIFFFICFV